MFGEAFEKALKAREKEFSTYDDISVYVATWNIGGFQPTISFDLTNLFNMEGNNAPDIVVVGLQEYIQSSATSMMLSQGDKGFLVWKENITSNLKYLDKYFFVKEQSLQGILLLIFAKEKMRGRISKIEADSVKTGLGGSLGNKGAVLIKLSVDDSSFCFINCHIEPGNKNNNTRLMNLIDIHQKAFQATNIGRSTVII